MQWVATAISPELKRPEGKSDQSPNPVSRLRMKAMPPHSRNASLRAKENLQFLLSSTFHLMALADQVGTRYFFYIFMELVFKYVVRSSSKVS